MVRYIVGIVHTSLSHYVVDAANEVEALNRAKYAFANSESEIMLGNEYDEIDKLFIEKEA